MNPEQIHFLIPCIERLPPDVHGIFPEEEFEGKIFLNNGVSKVLIYKIISSSELSFLYKSFDDNFSNSELLGN